MWKKLKYWDDWSKEINKKRRCFVSIIQSYFGTRQQDCLSCACSPKWIVVRNDKNNSSMYILQMYWSNLRDLTFYSYTIIKRIVIDTFSLKDYFNSNSNKTMLGDETYSNITHLNLWWGHLSVRSESLNLESENNLVSGCRTLNSENNPFRTMWHRILHFCHSCHNQSNPSIPVD